MKNIVVVNAFLNTLNHQFDFAERREANTLHHLDRVTGSITQCFAR